MSRQLFEYFINPADLEPYYSEVRGLPRPRPKRKTSAKTKSKRIVSKPRKSAESSASEKIITRQPDENVQTSRSRGGPRAIRRRTAKRSTA